MRARINNQDVDLISISASYELGQVPTFEIEVLAIETAWRTLQLTGQSVEILDGSEVLIRGLVYKTPKLIGTAGAAYKLKLLCAGELYRLAWERARAFNYAEASLVGILYDLLRRVGWRVLVTNLDPPDAVLSIDVSAKETLYGQITAIADAVPNFYTRYIGENSAGEPLLEIGGLGTRVEIVSDANLTAPVEIETADTEYIRYVDAYTRASDGTLIDLSDTIADGRYLTHPLGADFPITTLPDGTLVVENAALTGGGSIRKEYPNIISVTSPSPSEILEAGYALWLRVVAYLQQNTPYSVYKASFLAPQLPLVGDTARLRARVSEVYNDPAAFGAVRYVEVLDVDEDMFVTKVTTDFQPVQLVEQGDYNAVNVVRNYDVEFTPQGQLDSPDDAISVLEAVDTQDANAPAPRVLPALYSAALTFGIGSLPDPFCLPLFAKQYNIAGSPPMGATQVVTWYTVSPSTATVHLAQIPDDTLVTNNWIACVESPGGGWNPTGNITVTVYFQYYTD